MTAPEQIAWKLSVDHYGRYTRVVMQRMTNGQQEWLIVSDPSNQRDEGERICALTTRQMQEIAEIMRIEDIRGRRS